MTRFSLNNPAQRLSAVVLVVGIPLLAYGLSEAWSSPGLSACLLEGEREEGCGATRWGFVLTALGILGIPLFRWVVYNERPHLDPVIMKWVGVAAALVAAFFLWFAIMDGMHRPRYDYSASDAAIDAAAAAQAAAAVPAPDPVPFDLSAVQGAAQAAREAADAAAAAASAGTTTYSSDYYAPDAAADTQAVTWTEGVARMGQAPSADQAWRGSAAGIGEAADGNTVTQSAQRTTEPSPAPPPRPQDAEAESATQDPAASSSTDTPSPEPDPEANAG